MVLEGNYSLYNQIYFLSSGQMKGIGNLVKRLFWQLRIIATDDSPESGFDSEYRDLLEQERYLDIKRMNRDSEVMPPVDVQEACFIAYANPKKLDMSTMCGGPSEQDNMINRFEGIVKAYSVKPSLSNPLEPVMRLSLAFVASNIRDQYG